MLASRAVLGKDLSDEKGFDSGGNSFPQRGSPTPTSLAIAARIVNRRARQFLTSTILPLDGRGVDRDSPDNNHSEPLPRAIQPMAQIRPEGSRPSAAAATCSFLRPVPTRVSSGGEITASAPIEMTGLVESQACAINSHQRRDAADAHSGILLPCKTRRSVAGCKGAVCEML
jgi:hypothetical protein